MSNAIADAARYAECHEEVTRRGESEPCNKPAVALRVDLSGESYPGDPYPVCAYHARGPMIPLARLVAALGGVA